MIKSLLASTLMALVAVAPSLDHSATFSDNTHYSAQVLSVAPYRIKYTLSGETPYTPVDFVELKLDGQGTLLYAMEGHEALVNSEGLTVGSANHYAWPFNAWVNTDPANAIGSITPLAGSGFSMDFGSDDGTHFRLSSEFIVELKPGFSYNPDAVHIQMVYLTQLAAPYIDVFTPQ